MAEPFVGLNLEYHAVLPQEEKLEYLQEVIESHFSRDLLNAMSLNPGARELVRRLARSGQINVVIRNARW